MSKFFGLSSIRAKLVGATVIGALAAASLGGAPAMAATVNIVADNATYAAGSAIVPTFTATLSTAAGADVTCRAYTTADTTYTTALTVSTLAAGTYKIHCTGVAKSGNTIGTSTDGTLTVTAQTAPTCDASVYLYNSGFYKYAGSSFASVSGSNTATSLEALSWNDGDNFIYGITGSALYQFDSALKSVPAPASGTTATALGSLYAMTDGASASNAPTRLVGTAATSIGVTKASGDFVAIGGKYYMAVSSYGNTTFDLIDVSAHRAYPTITATGGTAKSGKWYSTDMAVIGSKGYGLYQSGGNSILEIANFTGSTPGATAVSLDEKNLSAQLQNVNETFSAIWADSAGNLFLYADTAHLIYEITAANLAAATPVASQVTASAVGSVAAVDGAGCSNSNGVTGATATTTAGATSIGATSATVAGTVATAAPSGSDIPASGIKFCYATSTANLSVSPTCVNATPNTLAANTASTAISATLTGLTAGTTYYFQSKATNSSGVSAYGSVQNFTTLNTWTLTAANASYVRGGAAPTLSATASPSAGLSGSASCSVYTTADTGYATALTLSVNTAAGTYVIHCTGAAASTYAPATLVNGTLTVSNATWTLTAANANYIAGGTAPTLSATANPAGGLSGSASCSVYTTADTGYATPLTLSSSTAAGTYVIHCTGTAATGYGSATLVDGTLTVTKSWTLTAANASYVRGGTAPTLSATANPVAALSGSASCSVYASADTAFATPLTLSVNTAAGTYVIRCTGTAAAGYAAATLVNGTLTVSNATWTLTAANASYVRGGTQPTLSATANPVAGLSGSASCAVYTTADTGYATPLTLSVNTAAGSYVIHCTGTAATGYGTPTLVDGTLTVTNATWTLTAANASYVRGGTQPTLSATANPVAGLSGSASCAVYTTIDTSYTTALSLSTSTPAGTYVIHCTGTAATGYGAPTLVNGTLTVTNLAWTLTAANASYIAGGTVPTLTATANPVAGLSGSASCAVYANNSYATLVALNASTAAGNYVIHCTGTASTGYGTATSVDGVLTVTLPWTLTATSASYIAGGSVPNLGATASPLAALSGSAACSVYANADTGYATPLVVNRYLAAGTYVIRCVGTPVAGYAAATLANATLTVTSPSYAITFNSQGGSSVAGLSYQVNDTVTLPTAPTLTGYTFQGWFLAASGGSALPTNYSPAGIGALTLYAQWVLTPYVVTFDSQGGNTVANGSYTMGGSVALPADPQRYGYEFAGWFDAATGGNLLTGSYSPAGIGAITIYAQWNKTVVLTGGTNVGQYIVASYGVQEPSYSYKYEWRRDGVLLPDQVTDTYVLTPADFGTYITFNVIIDMGTSVKVVTAGPPAPIGAGTLTLSPVPTVSGSYIVGQTLTATVGTWDAGVAFGYQWYANGVAIVGATGTSYTLTTAEIGKKITFATTGSLYAYNTVTATSSASTLVQGVLTLTPTPTLSATVAVGTRVNANVGTWDAGVGLSYAWYRDGVLIIGANAISYTPVAADLGSTLTVVVTGTKSNYVAVSVTSAGKIVAAGTILLAPVPTLSAASPVAGSAVTAVTGTWDAGVTFTYQWYIGGNAIAGATSASYTPTSSDVNKILTVRVTGSKPGYTSVSRTSLGYKVVNKAV